MDLKKKVAQVPDSPGVYIMKGLNGKIIYIGKAKSLSRRVKSYFQRKNNVSLKQKILVENIKDVEYILTETETEALFLESNLIKKNTPKYNISLKDDKSYPLVKITKEKFPAVFVCRPKIRDAAHFFGPYSNAVLLREALKVIRRVFSYRTCRVMPKSACLNFSLGLCPAPCVGLISTEKYLESIKSISLIFQGRQDCLLRELSKRMQKKSERLNFEEASKIRDQIKALGSLYKDKIGLANKHSLESQQLKKILGLSGAPNRIEAFDISNISGRQAVGSLVSFYKGRPDKSNYRRFKIKQVKTIDDYKMLAEVIRRRYSKLKEKRLRFPDLIIVDGGKGQLLAVKKQIDKLNLSIPLISIAKRREIIFSANKKAPIILPFTSDALQLVRRIRDEAHRFALAYHHILRRKVAFEKKVKRISK